MDEKENSIVQALSCDLKPIDLYHEKTVSKLYPEYNFYQPYGVWTGGIPLYAVLPFYKSLIVHLDPILTPERFKITYGFTIEEMIELREKGRLIILLRASYECYPKFYNSFLKDHVPLNNRFERVYLSGIGDNLSRFHKLLEKRYPSYEHNFSTEMYKDFERKIAKSEVREYAISMMAQRMAKLQIIGLEETIRLTLSNRKLSSAYDKLHKWNRALAVPTIDTLGGWDNLDEKHIDLITQDSFDNKNQIIFPKEILFWFNKQMNYSYPLSLESGKSFLKSIEELDEIAENHRLLRALQKSFLESNYENSINLMASSSNLFSEIKKRITKIEKTRTNLRKWISAPLRYANMPISGISFGIAATLFLSGATPVALGWGLAGAGSEIISHHADKVENFLSSLIHGRKSVPVIIWNRIRKKH